MARFVFRRWFRLGGGHGLVDLGRGAGQVDVRVDETARDKHSAVLQENREVEVATDRPTDRPAE